MADVVIRRAIPADAGACAEVMFAAFESLATRHAFPIEPETPEFTGVQMESMLATDGIYGLVAEQDGDVVGSAFADERGRIVGIGPVTVAPDVQGGGVGRTLMESLLHRCAERDVADVRLVQTAYNYRSLSLYAKLGFVVREPLSVFQGTTTPAVAPSGDVRVATGKDIEMCDDLCQRVHGHDRHGELCDWIDAGMAQVVERRGEITGYATGCGYFPCGRRHRRGRHCAAGRCRIDCRPWRSGAFAQHPADGVVPALRTSAGAAVDADDDRLVQRTAWVVVALGRLLGADLALITRGGRAHPLRPRLASM